MARIVSAFLLAFVLAQAARSQDSPPEAVVAAVKRATVFIKVEGSSWKGSGSGFVIAAEKDGALVATNYHVLAGPASDRKRVSPSEVVQIAKAAGVTVVFDSGTKTERALKGTPIAVDAENDLAILRVTGLGSPPAPIDYSNPPKLFETMPVLSFGYPFGQALGVNNASPAVTVGKASISSIRLHDSGDIHTVQIDGNLNPGNSGGPVVDSKGRLVGVATATIRSGIGIGLAVPAQELGKMMQGRLGGVHVSAAKSGEKLSLSAEVGVLDPTGAIRGVTLVYRDSGVSGRKPDKATPLAEQPGAKKVTLKIRDGVATGDFVIEDAIKGDLLVQALPDGSSKAALATVIRSFPAPGGVEPGRKVPDGWKEASTRDTAFTFWMPEKASQAEREQDTAVRGLRFRTATLRIDAGRGLVYRIERIVLPAAVAKADRADLEDLFRNVVASETGGKVIDETDARMSGLPGRDYVLSTERGLARCRVFVGLAGRVWVVAVEGSKEQVEEDATLTFLNSCRVGGPAVAKVDAPKVELPKFGPPPNTGTTANAPKGAIHGGVGPTTTFKEMGPEGSLLAGFEIGLTKWFDGFVIGRVQPVFRDGSKETPGESRGAKAEQTVKVLAKPGYAVGAITLKTGLGIDGLSVTFMKVSGDKLDPNDSYESDWYGGMGGGQPTRVSGDGALVLGLQGRTGRNNELVGLGLLLTGEKRLTDAQKAATKSKVIGWALDSEFVDHAPVGGLLVGVEVGVLRFVNKDVVRALRPIYLVGGKEQEGEMVGAGVKLTNTVKVLAKPGYAVAGFNVQNGIGMDGLSVVFMKVVDGRLDVKDFYESDWIGTKGNKVETIEGNGLPAVGLIGKVNKRGEATGIGLLMPPRR